MVSITVYIHTSPGVRYFIWGGASFPPAVEMSKGEDLSYEGTGNLQELEADGISRRRPFFKGTKKRERFAFHVSLDLWPENWLWQRLCVRTSGPPSTATLQIIPAEETFPRTVQFSRSNGFYEVFRLISMAGNLRRRWNCWSVDKIDPDFMLLLCFLFAAHVDNEMYLSRALDRLGAASLSKDQEPDIAAAFMKFSVVTKELSALMKTLVRMPDRKNYDTH